MTKPADKRRKFKHKRTMSETKKEFFDANNKRKRCAITGNILHGTAREGRGEIKKLSKTERRPSVPFGGVLSSKAREEVFVEMGKVAAGIKTLDAVDEKYKKYVKQGIRRAQ
jgi:ribosomal protein L34E